MRQSPRNGLRTPLILKQSDTLSRFPSATDQKPRRRPGKNKNWFAAQVRQLTAAEEKLSGAIKAAQVAPTDDKSGAYRDLLVAFGKLGSAGQEAIVQYPKTQV